MLSLSLEVEQLAVLVRWKLRQDFFERHDFSLPDQVANLRGTEILARRDLVTNRSSD